MESSYDVVIAGARVAGSILAAQLGDAGLNVLLTDAQTFPSDTLSTHLFRGAGLISVLDRLEVLNQVEQLGAPRLLRNYNYSDGVLQPNPRPPHPGRLGFCMSVRRIALDHLLLVRALRSPTVEFLPSTSVRRVMLGDDGRAIGVEVRGPAGPRQVRARVVVGADGRHSTVAKAVGAATERTVPAVRALYYCTVTGFARTAPGALYGAEFSLRGDEMAYALPSDSGVTCIAVSVNLDRFQWLRQDLERKFREIIAGHSAIADRFAAATRVSPVIGYGPQTNYVRTPVGPGWALVGDAGIFQDPWSGQGMDMAGTHATYLADALIGWLVDGVPEAEALGGYHARRDEHGLPVFENTTSLATDLSRIAALWGFPIPLAASDRELVGQSA
jgi:flavin-dependent dehydrogenase